jgi:heme/copper-type cytochrome/quinol oxidase subunit 1
MVTIFALMGYLGVPRREWSPIVPQLPFTTTYSPWLFLAFIFAWGIGLSQIPFMINIIASLRAKPLGREDQIVMPTPEMIAEEPRLHGPDISRASSISNQNSHTSESFSLKVGSSGPDPPQMKK